MSKRHGAMGQNWRAGALAFLLCFCAAAAAAAQQTTAPQRPGAAAPPSQTEQQKQAAPQNQPQVQSPAQPGKQAPGQAAEKSKAPAHITPQQARELFALVDQLIKFSSDETGLPIQSDVKRQITSRVTVESYLKKKFDEDRSAKRLQQGEIVLKKFGLLDRDFELKPFLLALLKEQIEAYYDAKTKTVYMLDWVGIDEQKPVLAHELTHALQDQHSNLEKWNDQTPDNVSTNYCQDTDHLARDEMDTARGAVAEGQATAVMMDYMLKPLGKSLIKDPEILDALKQQMSAGENSPVLARAPLLLSESMLFPYREGLSFEQDIWMDQGQTAAFAGALDNPPTSSWEIINPREYEKRHQPAVPMLLNIHPLVDKLYKPYDIGQIGQLDLHILTKVFGGNEASRALTPAWDGGLYWAGQRRDAKTPAEQASTASIALFYLSAWKNAASARAFARLYADGLGRQFSGLKPDRDAEKTDPDEHNTGAPEPESQEQVFSTSEGPVVITTRGKLVFVAESFPLDLARKLTNLLLDAQGSGELRQARATTPSVDSAPTAAHGDEPVSLQPLTSNLVHFFADYGVMKAAVQAEVKAAATAR